MSDSLWGLFLAQVAKNRNMSVFVFSSDSRWRELFRSSHDRFSDHTWVEWGQHFLTENDHDLLSWLRESQIEIVGLPPWVERIVHPTKFDQKKILQLKRELEAVRKNQTFLKRLVDEKKIPWDFVDPNLHKALDLWSRYFWGLSVDDLPVSIFRRYVLEEGYSIFTIKEWSIAKGSDQVISYILDALNPSQRYRRAFLNVSWDHISFLPSSKEIAINDRLSQFYKVSYREVWNAQVHQSSLASRLETLGVRRLGRIIFYESIAGVEIPEVEGFELVAWEVPFTQRDLFGRFLTEVKFTYLDVYSREKGQSSMNMVVEKILTSLLSKRRVRASPMFYEFRDFKTDSRDGVNFWVFYMDELLAGYSATLSATVSYPSALGPKRGLSSVPTPDFKAIKPFLEPRPGETAAGWLWRNAISTSY